MNRGLPKNSSDNRLEVLITFFDKRLELSYEYEDTFKMVREAVMKNYSFTKMSQFIIYSGDYQICEFFDDFSLEKMNYHFLSLCFDVRTTFEEDPFESFIKDKIDIDVLKIHKETVDKYNNNEEIEKDLTQCYTELELLFQNLNKMHENNSKEEDFLKKHGLTSVHEVLSNRCEVEAKKVREREAILEKKYLKIIELKAFERVAVDNVKENKNLVNLLYKNNLLIDKKDKLIINLKNQRKLVNKYRIESYKKKRM